MSKLEWFPWDEFDTQPKDSRGRRSRFSVRIACVFNNLGITSKSEAIEAFHSGRLLRARNFGIQSQRLVGKWLGLDPEPKDERPRCDHCGQVLLKKSVDT